MSKKDIIIERSMDMFVEYGFHGAPITKLIEGAQVSNGTFFYYFKTKEDLITAIYIKAKGSLHNRIQVESSKLPIRDAIKKIWINWVKWGCEQASEYRFIEVFASSPYINHIDREMVKDQYSFINNLLEKGISNKELAKMDVKLLSELIYGSIRATIRYCHANEVLSDDELTAVFNRTWHTFKGDQ